MKKEPSRWAQPYLWTEALDQSRWEAIWLRGKVVSQDVFLNTENSRKFQLRFLKKCRHVHEIIIWWWHNARSSKLVYDYQILSNA